MTQRLMIVFILPNHLVYFLHNETKSLPCGVRFSNLTPQKRPKKAPAERNVIVYQMYKFNISPCWGFLERLITSSTTNITSLWDFAKNEILASVNYSEF
jgi:hypothetical protein